MRRNTFSHRIVNSSINLSETLVQPPSVNCFKSCLDKHLCEGQTYPSTLRIIGIQVKSAKCFTPTALWIALARGSTVERKVNRVTNNPQVRPCRLPFSYNTRRNVAYHPHIVWIHASGGRIQLALWIRHQFEMNMYYYAWKIKPHFRLNLGQKSYLRTVTWQHPIKKNKIVQNIIFDLIFRSL